MNAPDRSPLAEKRTEAFDVFVFGSNRQGCHGAGAAKDAYEQFGAEWGKGEGHHGRSYAIPTRSFIRNELRSLALHEIEKHVQKFLYYARGHSGLIFLVTALGTGHAGYKDEQIGPMFKGAPENCLLPRQWEKYR